jgi:tetratricopeptide (TPR) repeat protein
MADKLAVLYHNQGRYEEAKPLYKRALIIREQVLGENHPDTAQALNNLAELYRTLGRYEEAEPLYMRAITTNEQALDQKHPDIASNLNNLASRKVYGNYTFQVKNYPRRENYILK